MFLACDLIYTLLLLHLMLFLRSGRHAFLSLSLSNLWLMCGVFWLLYTADVYIGDDDAYIGGEKWRC